MRVSPPNYELSNGNGNGNETSFVVAFGRCAPKMGLNSALNLCITNLLLAFCRKCDILLHSDARHSDGLMGLHPFAKDFDNAALSQKL